MTFLEAFDKPYLWNEIKPAELYEFTTKDGSVVKFELNELYDPDIDGYYLELLFTRDGKTDMTGEGDAFRIFATIKDIVSTIASQIIGDTQYLVFFAKKKDKGRIKLYERLMKFLQKKLKYRNGSSSVMGDQIVFTLSN